MSNAVHETDSKNTVASKPPLDPHLKALENEAIHIFREVAAEFDKPVMLYSIGKDSSVLLHLARKAFFPGPPPFPLMHINTTIYQLKLSVIPGQRQHKKGQKTGSQGKTYL